MKSIFQLNLRSLSLFRIVLGLVLLLDLSLRLLDLKAHYTDEGILPRIALLKFVWLPGDLSLHALSGGIYGVGFLFLLQIGFAIALIIGYYSKIATVASWILLISLHSRNPIILSGGDTLLRMLLFWSMFLPLDRYFSVSKANKNQSLVHEKGVNEHLSAGSVGFILQIICLYLCSGWLKTGESWENGLAIFYVLSLDMHTTALGDFLHQWPSFERQLTHFVLWIEKWAWIFLLIPWKQAYIRGSACVVFMSLHVGFGMTLELGLFPWICMAAWIPFIPAIFWESNIGRRLSHFIGTVYSSYHQSTEKIASEGRGENDLPAQTQKIVTQIYTYQQKMMTLLGIMAIVLMVWVNASTLALLPLPEGIRIGARLVKISQKWDLFAPEPITNDGWYSVPAKYKGKGNGELWLDRKEFSWERPASMARTYKNNRWRKYFKNIKRRGFKDLKPYLGAYFCRKRKEKNGQLEIIRIYFMHEESRPPGEPLKVEAKMIWEEKCQ